MFIAFALEGVGILLLSTFGANPVAFVILTGLVFFAWGEIYSLFPATCADAYGRKFAAGNYGLLYTAKGTAALLVPVTSVMAAASGGWETVFISRRGDEHRGRVHGVVRAEAVAPAHERRTRGSPRDGGPRLARGALTRLRTSSGRLRAGSRGAVAAWSSAQQ